MKRLFLIIVPISIAVMLTLTQCDKEGKGKGCEDVPCEKVFKLHLKNPEGQPVILDSCKVLWVNENRFLEHYFPDDVRLMGIYIIVDDGMQKELLNKNEVMHFTGYLNNKIVCERDVLVGADCCHVNYLGEEPLTQVIHDLTNEINVTLKNTESYSHTFVLGDEEGASIKVQAQHHENSELVRDESTNMNVEYRYKPITDFVGNDYVVLEVYIKQEKVQQR
jgi:hypothetical protein